jgi:hypothetical protein
VRILTAALGLAKAPWRWRIDVCRFDVALGIVLRWCWRCSRPAQAWVGEARVAAACTASANGGHGSLFSQCQRQCDRLHYGGSPSARLRRAFIKSSISVVTCCRVSLSEAIPLWAAPAGRGAVLARCEVNWIQGYLQNFAVRVASLARPTEWSLRIKPVYIKTFRIRRALDQPARLSTSSTVGPRCPRSRREETGRCAAARAATASRCQNDPRRPARQAAAAS